MQEIKSLLPQLAEKIDSLYSLKQDDSIGTEVTAKFDILDDAINNLEPGKCYLIGGCASAYRTSKLSSIVCEMAVNKDLPVILFTQSESALEITTRLIGQASGISTTKLRAGALEDNDWPLLVDALSQLNDSQLFICDDNVNEVSLIRQIHSIQVWNKNLGLVVIDDFWLATEFVLILKKICLDFNIPIILGWNCWGARTDLLTDQSFVRLGESDMCLADIISNIFLKYNDEV